MIGPIPVCVIGLASPGRYLGSVPTLMVEPTAVQLEEEKLSPQADLPPVPAPAQPAPRGLRYAQILLLVLLFSSPALMSLRGSCANDGDIWWHMRTGEWILQHHSVPRVDAFSGPAAGQSWVAYSWLFELIVAKLFLWKGLVGLAMYTTGMILVISAAVYHMVRRLQADLAVAALLTFAAMFGMGRMFTPRPWLFTILFFVLELDILAQVRRTGKTRELLWLPVIFAFWANVHIQFVDGLMVLGFAWVHAILARRQPAMESRVRPLWLGAALFASVLATLVNPYGWRIYAVAHDLATQAGALNKITELQAIPFRNLADFLILLLAMGSAAALAWQRRPAYFEGGLLIFAAVLTFRSQRDVWVMATVAAMILASTISRKGRTDGGLPRFTTRMTVVIAAFVLAAGFSVFRVNNAELESRMTSDWPIQAVEAIQQKGYPGPLFNDFNWGGYLIWNLRVPVSIDGRQNLYGDPRMDRSVATWGGAPDWASDSELRSAGLVIGPTGAPLSQLLKTDPHFQLAYSDKVATVFVAKK